MITIRHIAPLDIEAFYAISLATGDSGGDASHLYRDGRLMGHMYAAPYAEFCPRNCFVAEDRDGVGGYVVGALDTRAFEACLEREWWPGLREIHPEPGGDPSGWDADQRRGYLIHHPRRAPEGIVRSHPAHLHMNLLPRLQGRGLGTSLLDRWISDAREQGAQAVHIGVSASNRRGLRFWESRGFAPLSRTSDPGSSGTVWCGRKLVSRSRDSIP